MAGREDLVDRLARETSLTDVVTLSNNYGLPWGARHIGHDSRYPVVCGEQVAKA